MKMIFVIISSLFFSITAHTHDLEEQIAEAMSTQWWAPDHLAADSGADAGETSIVRIISDEPYITVAVPESPVCPKEREDVTITDETARDAVHMNLWLVRHYNNLVSICESTSNNVFKYFVTSEAELVQQMIERNYSNVNEPKNQDQLHLWKDKVVAVNSVVFINDTEIDVDLRDNYSNSTSVLSEFIDSSTPRRCPAYSSPLNIQKASSSYPEGLVSDLVTAPVALSYIRESWVDFCWKLINIEPARQLANDFIKNISRFPELIWGHLPRDSNSSISARAYLTMPTAAIKLLKTQNWGAKVVGPEVIQSVERASRDLFDIYRRKFYVDRGGMSDCKYFNPSKIPDAESFDALMTANSVTYDQPNKAVENILLHANKLCDFYVKIHKYSRPADFARIYRPNWQLARVFYFFSRPGGLDMASRVAKNADPLFNSPRAFYDFLLLGKAVAENIYSFHNSIVQVPARQINLKWYQNITSQLAALERVCKKNEEKICY